MKRQILQMKNIWKKYRVGEEEQAVLKNVNFELYEGEFVYILGPSGSGKTTMMNILGCLDVASEGEYILSGKNVAFFNETELAHVRNNKIGFIFQSFHLLPRLTALENVELPLIYARIPKKERIKQAFEALSNLGLKDKLYSYPNQLSGGQQQRVAIARALVTKPDILLADEPTGSLDQNTGREIIEMFLKLNSEGKTIVMITHDEKIAENAGRMVKILDGRLSERSSC